MTLIGSDCKTFPFILLDDTDDDNSVCVSAGRQSKEESSKDSAEAPINYTNKNGPEGHFVSLFILAVPIVFKWSLEVLQEENRF